MKSEKVERKFGNIIKTPYLCNRLTRNRDLAQLVAHTSGGREVAGSSPVIPTFFEARTAHDCRRFSVIQFNYQSSSMYLDKAKKEEIFGQYGKSNSDTGSAESQIALFSYRISHLTEHLKKNRKDYTTARSLTKLVGKRRALLDYLKDRDITRYRAIVKALGLRR